MSFFLLSLAEWMLGFGPSFLHVCARSRECARRSDASSRFDSTIVASEKCVSFKMNSTGVTISERSRSHRERKSCERLLRASTEVADRQTEAAPTKTNARSHDMLIVLYDFMIIIDLLYNLYSLYLPGRMAHPCADRMANSEQIFVRLLRMFYFQTNERPSAAIT